MLKENLYSDHINPRSTQKNKNKRANISESHVTIDWLIDAQNSQGG